MVEGTKKPPAGIASNPFLVSEAKERFANGEWRALEDWHQSIPIYDEQGLPRGWIMKAVVEFGPPENFDNQPDAILLRFQGQDEVIIVLNGDQRFDLFKETGKPLQVKYSPGLFIPELYEGKTPSEADIQEMSLYYAIKSTPEFFTNPWAIGGTILFIGGGVLLAILFPPAVPYYVAGVGILGIGGATYSSIASQDRINQGLAMLDSDRGRALINIHEGAKGQGTLLGNAALGAAIYGGLGPILPRFMPARSAFKQQLETVSGTGADTVPPDYQQFSYLFKQPTDWVGQPLAPHKFLGIPPGSDTVNPGWGGGGGFVGGPTSVGEIPIVMARPPVASTDGLALTGTQTEVVLITPSVAVTPFNNGPSSIYNTIVNFNPPPPAVPAYAPPLPFTNHDQDKVIRYDLPGSKKGRITLPTPPNGPMKDPNPGTGPVSAPGADTGNKIIRDQTSGEVVFAPGRENSKVFVARGAGPRRKDAFSTNKTEIRWKIEGDLEGGVKREDLQNVVDKVQKLLSKLKPPKTVEIRAKPNALPMVDLDGSGAIWIPTNTPHAPVILAHEFTHRFVKGYFYVYIPHLMKLLENPQRFQTRFDKLTSQLGKDGADEGKIMEEVRKLDQEAHLVLKKGELIRSYSELFADLVAVIYSKDPQAIYTLLREDFSSPLKIYELVDELASYYRRFDLQFGPSNLEKWKEDLNYYDKELETDGRPDRFLMLAPVRSWLWEKLEGAVKAEDERLPIYLKGLLDVMLDELKLHIKELDSGVALDLEKLNRDLIDKFLAIYATSSGTGGAPSRYVIPSPSTSR